MKGGKSNQAYLMRAWIILGIAGYYFDFSGSESLPDLIGESSPEHIIAKQHKITPIP